MRLYALDSIELEPVRADLMARLEYHRDRLARYERILQKRFPQGAATRADTGRLLLLRMGLRYERAASEWCEEALQTLSAGSDASNVRRSASSAKGADDRSQACRSQRKSRSNSQCLF